MKTKTKTNIMTLTPDWQKWLVENLQKGCTHASLLESMLANNFTRVAATNFIAQVAAAHAINLTVETKVETVKPATPEKYRYEASRIASGNIINLTDRQVRVAMRLAQPEVVVVENFMSPDECEMLIALSKAKLERSGVVDPETGETIIISERSSEGCYFHRGESEFIEKLDNRISSLMNWPVDHGEGIQILHYSKGGEYKPHFDYFPAEQSGSASHLASGGQRVATLVMYLSDVESGGETVFPDMGLKVAPRQGSATYFSYFNSLEQVDPATLHAGEPVIAGEKWIATKWMRQGKY